MTYNLVLANITPDPNAFTVLVNSIIRTVNVVEISGAKVQLTLASPVVYGDVVTVVYTKPASNPLQTSIGAEAESLTIQSVINFAQISATNYYISSSTGDDNEDGRSESTAWETISKVNGNAFSPGDSILFMKGGTWRETLDVTSSGTSDNYICYGTYGTGVNPKIIGSEIATTWTDQGSNVWKSNNTFLNPRINTADIHFIESDVVKWGNYKANTSSLAAKYDWTWSSNYIYVYSTSDPGTAFSSVEIPQRYSCIDTYHKEYIHFDGIDVLYAGYIGYDDNNSHSDHINISGLIVENCEVAYIGGTTSTQAGFGFAVVYSDLVIRNCVIHDCGRRGISLDIYGSGFTASNAIIENNTIYGGFHTTGLDLSVGSGGYTGSWDGVYVRNNTIEDVSTSPYVYPSNQIFLQNWAWSSQSAKAENIFITNNIFKYPNGSAINMEGMNKVYVYNNVFYEVSVMGSYVIQLWIDANNTNIEAKNNIFYSSNPSSNFGIEVYCLSPVANVDLDYNLYYRVNNTLPLVRVGGSDYYMNTITSTLRTNVGWETHSPTPANPQLMSLTDFHVQGGSAALGAGLTIPEVTTDFEGIAYTDPPNIGSYATPIVTTIPTYLGAVIENSTPAILEMRYSLALANIISATSAFTVMVNSVSRTVNSVVITGAKVQLTLSDAVEFGDAVSIAYTKPALNPLQASSGAEAESFTILPVINNVNPIIPVYVSSAIENVTPTLLEMTYNLVLANITPDPNAFTVLVNSIIRTVNVVEISGAKVQLTLVNPVVYGDVVTVAYTKAPINPLQTSSGGQAETISSKSVTNNVNPPSPEYISSVIEDAEPSVLEISFSLSLTNSIPAVSTFSITVNSITRIVNSVGISGTKVMLTLASPVIADDEVIVSYIKPATNPLQTSSGGEVATFTNKTVTNSVGVINSPPVVNVTYLDNFFSGFVDTIDASGSTDSNNDVLSFEWTAPAGVDISSANNATIQFLPPILSDFETFDFSLSISDGKSIQTEDISIGIWPYKPDILHAVVTNISASSYLGTDLPINISDGSLETYWSSNGDYQWLTCKLRDSFIIDHFKLSFSNENIGNSYFDILASQDSIVWDPLLSNATSSGFSDNLQVFLPAEESLLNAYSYIKLVGHGNSMNLSNKISELQIFGRSVFISKNFNELGIKVYPNPTSGIINIFFENSPLGKQIIRISNMLGYVKYEALFASGLNYLQIPVTFPPGPYIIQLISEERIRGTGTLIIQ
jgi:uncharacterized repeat protein (TIGR02059 family)